MMKIYLLFYMCHFAMGLTHCYKTTVFLHLLYINDICNASVLVQLVLFADDTNIFLADCNLSSVITMINKELKLIEYVI